MTTFHAVVWIDHSEAHVLMFDREHMEAQKIKSRSHTMNHGKSEDYSAFFAEIATALAGTHEVLVTGPGLTRGQFRDWCTQHHAVIAGNIVDSVSSDHPSDGQLVAMARQYFKKFDNMAGSPATA
ncbi:MAG: hypothetical protein RIR09_1306 [Pseudomonadota bacterium]|jgi:stalled ribosome rescue protein Dom34